MLYEASFAMQFRPFVAAPSPDRYFAGASIEAARVALTRSIERGEGPGMISGPSGIGKSLLLEVLARHFKGRLDPARLTGGHLTTRRALLQVISFELGLPYRGKEDAELRLGLMEHLTRPERASSGMLLLVDEAHNLPIRLLEEIRMVTNIIRDGQPRVHLVLSGGPALEEKLAHPKLDSLSQRLAARCYLEPLSRAETYDYVAHQVSLAGGEWEKIFSRASCEAIYRATAGIPRLINQVADHALMLAYADGLPQADPALVERAWSELQQLPAPWVGVDLPKHAATQPASVVEFGQLSDEQETEASETAAPPTEEVIEDCQDDESTAEHAEETMRQVERHLAEISQRLEDSAAQDKQKPMTVVTVHEEFEEEVLLVERYPTAAKGTPPVAGNAASANDSRLREPTPTLDSPEPAAELAQENGTAANEVPVADSPTDELAEPLVDAEEPRTIEDVATTEVTVTTDVAVPVVGDDAAEDTVAEDAPVDLAEPMAAEEPEAVEEAGELVDRVMMVESVTVEEMETLEEFIVDRYARLDAHRMPTRGAPAGRGLMAANARIFDEVEPLPVDEASEQSERPDVEIGEVENSSESPMEPAEVPSVVEADEIDTHEEEPAMSDLPVMAADVPPDFQASIPGTEAEYPLDPIAEEIPAKAWPDEPEAAEIVEFEPAEAWSLPMHVGDSSGSHHDSDATPASLAESEPRSEAGVCVADLPELVVVEDPPPVPADQPKADADVRRQEYRQLFARLRRGI
ncbi:MAG: AAA family ATPase [Pirellulales bacterium]